MPFILQIDTSEVWNGVVLSQTDAERCDHSGLFQKKIATQLLLPREQKYDTNEKQCQVVKLWVEVFQIYLLGKEFTI